MGFSKLVVKLFAETVVNERSLCHQYTSIPFFQLLLSLVQLFCLVSPWGLSHMALMNLVWSLLKWQILLCRAQHPWVCPAPLSSCLPLTEVATEPVCVWPKSVTSLPPRPGEALSQCSSCGSSQTCQSSSYLQGCGVTASFMRWRCLVLVDLTSLSPPSVFQRIWPSPSRE